MAKSLNTGFEQDLARVRAFIDSHEWHFAKTMPQIPHWYCLRKDKGDIEEFLWFATFIKEHSTPGQFYGKTYHYFYLDGYKYWSMDGRPEDCDLINRDKVEENPFTIVREEKWTEDINGIHIVHTKSYDAQDRVVGVSTVQFRGDKNIGYCAQYVEADGYWHGGACDEETGMGCQIYRPFIEGEVQ